MQPSSLPDHIHLVFDALDDPSGNPYRLPEIMRQIKGSSSRAINLILARQGTVWHNESFDHVLRADEDVDPQRNTFFRTQ